MSVKPDQGERLTPHAAGWYAGEDPHASYYGPPLRLANSFRDALGLPAGDSAIVSTELPEAEERLRGTRVMAAARAGLLRTSWHVYNTDGEVDELLDLLGVS